MSITSMETSSNFLALWRKISLGFRGCDRFLDRLCRDSGTLSLLLNLSQKTGIYFRYSFLGRLTEDRTEETSRALSESFISKLLNKKFNSLKESISDYFRESLIARALNELARMLDSAPMKTVGPLIILFIILNIVLSLSLKGQIDLSGWIFRLCFIIVGLICWTCNAKWQDLKKTSFVLRKLNEKN